MEKAIDHGTAPFIGGGTILLGSCYRDTHYFGFSDFGGNSYFTPLVVLDITGGVMSGFAEDKYLPNSCKIWL